MVHADMKALAKAMGTTVGVMLASPASPPAAVPVSPRAMMDDGDAIVEAPAEEWGAFVSGGAPVTEAAEAAPAACDAADGDAAACVKRVEALEARMQQLTAA
jgi:hypothetical protein